MLELLLKMLNLQSCTHPNVETNCVFSYCPDCGKLIHINWYIVRCSCCGKRRLGIIKNGKIIPVARFCTNCGTEEYIIEKLDNINYFNMNYAIAKKEEEKTPLHRAITETWVDEEEIIKKLKALPHNLSLN